PNDLLAVEYIRALDRFCPGVVPVPVKRVGAAHGSKADGGIFSSASRVRELALSGVMPGELPLPENVREILEAERERGAFPFDPGKLDAAVLGVICRMGEDAVALTPDGGDGLASRVCRFAKTAVTAEELCQKAKSRNFTLARVRRCVWQAFLGITREDQARSPQYLRLLAVGENGREILREMELTASVPVITKPAMLNRLSGEGEKDAALEARADSLRSLALPQREDMMKKSPFVKKSAQQSL
ncbi:MAG: nucleotidyltransferase family protein, partial [Clostridia bacterium]|nr:nucleotidyltransferase family protein [Clostridia bacterium]